MADCVTYQGIKSCTFAPGGSNPVAINLVTSISISDSLTLTPVKGDDDIYARCQFVSAGSVSGSLTTTDIESLKTAVSLGVSGTLEFTSEEKVGGVKTLTNTVQNLTFSDNSTSFATETGSADSLTFTATSAGGDGQTNPLAKVFSS